LVKLARQALAEITLAEDITSTAFTITASIARITRITGPTAGRTTAPTES
jgi:hypothetical protein